MEQTASPPAHVALTSAHGGRLQCVVVTPEMTVRESDAEFIALPLSDGEIGIAPGHSPMIGRMGYGEMRLVSGGTTDRLYVDGGFVQVVDNVVSVLTNRAVPASSIDLHMAAEHLEAARKRKANTPELLAIRDRLELQARAQIRAARKAR
ncbi:MAG TPA: ATP synthase F1 subunit epsilon [Pirellulales bacterium]|nr:ATP synthase F1 subunit epsilon [Pirellulales bacterium]